MAVTVAVVSWNTRELLVRCLRSLTVDVEAGRAQVYVVDNGSADGSVQAARAFAPWAQVLQPGANLGFGAAVNLVAARTRRDGACGDWLLAANADVALEPGALEAMLASGVEACVGCVAPRLLLPGGGTQQSVHLLPTVPFTLAFNLGLHRLSPQVADRLCIEGSWSSEGARDVAWALGACLLVRRAAFDAVGGFDERQWMYAEDIDFGWRLREGGWLIRYEPGARVLHESGAATKVAFGDERIAHFMAATYAMLLRRRGLTRTWTTAALNFAGAAGRVVWMTPLAPVSARWRGSREENRRWLRAHRQGLRSRSVLRRGERRALADSNCRLQGVTEDKHELARLAASYAWYHTIELAEGVVTTGVFDHRPALDHYLLPADLSGMRCLDIGTMDGFWAFEMERRGAREVLAADVGGIEDLDWPASWRMRVEPTLDETKEARFRLAHTALRSRVKRIERSVYSLDSDLGQFDLIFCGDLLVHLKDPITAVQRIRAVCRGSAIICNPVKRFRFARWRALAELDGMSEFQWWLLSEASIKRMMLAAGFKRAEAGPSFELPARGGGNWKGLRAVVRGYTE